VVDLKTGDAYPNLSQFASGTTDAWLFETSEFNAFMNSPVSLDKDLNYNVDAVYFGETYELSGSWKGKAYRILIPWDWSAESTYVDNPNDGSDPWTLSCFFDAQRPITAPMSLSIDDFDNIWVYFGTGRYLGQDDKSNTDTQYLFGIVDPFFNSYYDTAPENYYLNYSLNKELAITDLFMADPYVVTTTREVFEGSLYLGGWNDLLSDARAEDGWYRTQETTGERCLTKPSVLGGIVFIPTFVPNNDICGYGGASDLYALFYETGTAYYDAVLPEGTDTAEIAGDEYEKVLGKVHLGAGMSSALGIHLGQEEGAKAFVQQSTGTVLEAEVTPALAIKSSLINWNDK
jgi:type IV pilus assembly protein PilY1